MGNSDHGTTYTYTASYQKGEQGHARRAGQFVCGRLGSQCVAGWGRFGSLWPAGIHCLWFVAGWDRLFVASLWPAGITTWLLFRVKGFGFCI